MIGLHTILAIRIDAVLLVVPKTLAVASLVSSEMLLPSYFSKPDAMFLSWVRFFRAFGRMAVTARHRSFVLHSADNRVSYDIFAFSRPRSFLARFAYPLSRSVQRKFGRDSKAAMLNAVQ
jgi:uncharacterized protein DUF1990